MQRGKEQVIKKTKLQLIISFSEPLRQWTILPSVFILMMILMMTCDITTDTRDEKVLNMLMQP